MSTTPPDETRSETAAPAKKASRRTAAGQNKDDKGKAVPKKKTAASVTAEERWKMIADAAYYRAQARGFEPGHEHEDWLLAEREVDGILRR